MAHRQHQQETVVAPKDTAVVLARGRTERFARTLPFYSHSRRSPFEEAEDRALGGESVDRRVFSNLFASPVDIGAAAAARFGLVKSAWPSTEHLFQAAKCALRADQLFVATLHSAGDAARYGQGRMLLNARQRTTICGFGGVAETDFVRCGSSSWKRTASGYVPLVAGWEDTKKAVMLAALRAKFTQQQQQHGSLAQTSLAAIAGCAEGPVLLVEHTRNDRQWADAGDGSGMNMLGKMLTMLALEIRNGGAADDAAILDAEFLARPNSELADYRFQ